MIGETSIGGVYVPSLLLLAMASLVLTAFATRLLALVGAYRLVAYRPIVDLALGDLVAKETHEQNVARVATATAALAVAHSNRDTAALNLARTTVRATVRGTVTNLDLHPGDYIATGTQAMALVDADSLRVEGYFEETKLGAIHLGDPVTVHLMGDPRPLAGRVDSIAAGISDVERTNSSNLLPTVNPTFNWVRLAQRIPVRVKLTRVPQGVALIVGRTATVTINPGTRS